MLTPLVPDAPHLIVLAATFAVALLSIGIGTWLGARTTQTAFAAGWGAAGLATVAAGTLTHIPLSAVMAALGLAGALGLIRIIVSQALDIGLFGRVALLAIPLIAGAASADAIGWDDFSHWLPNLSYLCLHDHFPTLALPSGSDHAGYPYGLALPGYAVWLLTGQVPDNVALHWNLIAILAAAASIARILARRHPGFAASPWACAAVGLLLAGLACPSFVPKIVFSNMADTATGAVLAILAAEAYDWVAASTGQRVRLALTAGFTAAALLNLRQANAALLGLALIGLLVAGCRDRRATRPAAALSLAITCVPPVLLALLWGRYVSQQIPGGDFAIMPLADWRWALLPTIAGSMLRVMVAKTGLLLVILFLAGRGLLSLRPRDPLPPQARTVALLAAVVCVGMIGFLGFTYLAAGFSEQEAVAAASFWRYMGETGPLAMLAVIAVVPLQGWRRVSMRPAAAALVAVTLLLPVATVRLYRSDLTSPVPALRAMADAVDQAVPRDAPLMLLDVTGNGFAPLVMDYELVQSARNAGRPGRPVSEVYDVHAMNPVQAAKLDLAQARYIWLAEGAADLSPLLGATTALECSYLLRRNQDATHVVQRWPIGRFKWLTQHATWASATDPACR